MWRKKRKKPRLPNAVPNFQTKFFAKTQFYATDLGTLSIAVGGAPPSIKRCKIAAFRIYFNLYKQTFVTFFSGNSCHFWNSPGLQLPPFLMYPSLQRHSNFPGTFTHCSFSAHGFWVHSSTSEKYVCYTADSTFMPAVIQCHPHIRWTIMGKKGLITWGEQETFAS